MGLDAGTTRWWDYRHERVLVQWPSTWEDYERGQSPRQGSVNSSASHIRFDEGSPAAVSDHLEIPRSNGTDGDIEQGSHPRRYARHIDLSFYLASDEVVHDLR